MLLVFDTAALVALEDDDEVDLAGDGAEFVFALSLALALALVLLLEEAPAGFFEKKLKSVPCFFALGGDFFAELDIVTRLDTR